MALLPLPPYMAPALRPTLMDRQSACASIPSVDRSLEERPPTRQPGMTDPDTKRYKTGVSVRVSREFAHQTSMRPPSGPPPRRVITRTEVQRNVMIAVFRRPQAGKPG